MNKSLVHGVSNQNDHVRELIDLRGRCRRDKDAQSEEDNRGKIYCDHDWISWSSGKFGSASPLKQMQKVEVEEIKKSK